MRLLILCLHGVALGSTPVNVVVVNIAEIMKQWECARPWTSGSRNEILKGCIEPQMLLKVLLINFQVPCREIIVYYFIIGRAFSHHDPSIGLGQEPRRFVHWIPFPDTDSVHSLKKCSVVTSTALKKTDILVCCLKMKSCIDTVCATLWLMRWCNSSNSCFCSLTISGIYWVACSTGSCSNICHNGKLLGITETIWSYILEELFQNRKLLLLLQVSGEMFQCDARSVAPEMRLQTILHHRCTLINQIVEGVMLWTQ